MPEITQLEIALIQCDNDIRTREVREDGPFAILCELYRDDGPEALPPVVVFHDADDVYWLADGHHRVKAAREALSQEGARTLPAEVYKGSKRDAILYAAGANAKHGQPLAAHEKQAVVQRLLKDPEWVQWSDRKIARHTGTSHTFVSTLRKQLVTADASGNGGQMPALASRTVQRGGRTYHMQTGNIGQARGPQPALPTAPASYARPQQANQGGLSRTVTQGLDELKRAWYRATLAARRTFRDWVLTQTIADYGLVTPSERTRHFSDLIAAICKRESNRGA
jgi:hypothetical protein